MNVQINKIKNNLNIDYKFCWENKIKEIWLKSKNGKDKSNLNKVLFNDLFAEFPKEYVINNLNKLFNI